MYPDARTELLHRNPFELLVAVILSAQSTDAAVNRVTPSLFESFPTPASFADASLQDLETAIKTIGLYRNKAANIKATARMIIENHGGEVPRTYHALTALPGVGRKTANVVLSVAFHVPRIAVDTHVERVSKRLRLASMDDAPHVVEEKLMRKVPRSRWVRLHHQMIFFGRYHCKAKRPECERCKLRADCRYPNI